MTDPQDYYNELLQIDTEQGLSKLRTLALEFEAALERLPRLRQEIDNLLAPRAGVNYGELAERAEPALVQAADYLLELDLLPADLRQAPAIREFEQSAAQALTLRTVTTLVPKFHKLCAETRQTLADERRQAEARAEAERKAKEKAEAERKAREKAEAERKAKLEKLIPQMIAIPAGEFTMGGVKGRDDVDGGIYGQEEPAHRVRVAAFRLGKFPVTFEQFDLYCEETGVAKPSDQDWGRGQQPVIWVNWHDAQAYCAWLSELTGKRFRLPSEAEWEYAARAGGNGAFPWGQQADAAYANYGRIFGRATPVGVYPPNAFGLQDMHGNVLEWCQDGWHDNYQGAPDNGTVWSGGGNRVVRGGSWIHGARHLRSADRRRYGPDDRSYDLGFRLAQG